MSEKQLKVWRIDDGERHWAIAPTAERALEIVAEIFGCTLDEYRGDSVEVVPDDEAITIRCDDEHDEAHTKTAKEWVADEGEGLLCSTVY